jgi:hypothetical protein
MNALMIAISALCVLAAVSTIAGVAYCWFKDAEREWS